MAGESPFTGISLLLGSYIRDPSLVDEGSLALTGVPLLPTRFHNPRHRTGQNPVVG